MLGRASCSLFACLRVRLGSGGLRKMSSTSPRHSWIVTNVSENHWSEHLQLEAADLGISDCSVKKRTLKGGLRDGVDIIEVNNGNFSFKIVPTRGMGIWKAAYRGIPLEWQSPIKGGPVNPMFVNLSDRGGLGWLEGFDELIVRCGLDSNGVPGVDQVPDNTGKNQPLNLTLHGRIANLPAHYVEIVADRNNEEIQVIGHVDEAGLYLPSLRLSTVISTKRKSNKITIVDRVHNLKSGLSEMQLLYHCNFGQPFLEQGSHFKAPIKEVAPRDARAAENGAIHTYNTYGPPTPNYTEQVYYHQLYSDQKKQTVTALINAKQTKAVSIRYSTEELPYFTLWKCLQPLEDGYVTGLEMGTNLPNPKLYERQKGRVRTLNGPKDYFECTFTLEVHDTNESVTTLLQEIDKIQQQGEVLKHEQPHF